MATNLPTDLNQTYPDQSPGDALHQQHHDQIHAYTNEHDTAPDPHGDRAYADGKFARGEIGYAQTTAIQTGVTTEVDLTGLTVAVTVESGRKIRVTGSGTVTARSGTALIRGVIYEDGAFKQRWVDTTLMAPDEGVRWEASVRLTPTAGTHTYKLTLQRAAGTGTAELTASSVLPSFILVEDLGAL